MKDEMTHPQDTSMTPRHDHAFGQDEKKPGEIRTLIVVLLTAVTMAVEITAGVVYGSMALWADGLHMASHAAALTISMAAYIYARHFANDERFSFGVGKVNSLAGFTGAVLLAVFALMMAWESVHRLANPVEIAFNQALIVAFAGLLVNGVSVFILGHESSHDHGHGHGDDHVHDHEHEHSHAKADVSDRHQDHNLRSAYLHVLADALTSLLAIFALLAGKYFNLYFLDPLMGVLGAILVARWSVGLMIATSRVLLDYQAPEKMQETIRESVEKNGDVATDLHAWVVAPGLHALILSIEGDAPKSPDEYRAMLPNDLQIVHVTIEVRRRTSSP
jgi:cation diffusion facilitator family transporter